MMTLPREKKRFVLPNDFANLRDLLDEAAIIAITDLKGTIIYANNKFCEISKYSRSELIGQNHLLLNFKDQPKESLKSLQKTVFSGKVWRGEICCLAKDGTRYWLDKTVIPISDNQGKLAQYMTFSYVITQRKLLEEELKLVSQRILQAHEEERSRISSDIHDNIGQLLIALKINFVNNGADLAAHNPQVQEFITNIRTRIDNIIEETRNLSHQLSPSQLKYAGLIEAVRKMIESFNSKGLLIKFRHSELEKVDLSTKDIIIYRIIQESLVNIIKHAQAKNVKITISLKKNILHITIEDDGKGFDINKSTGLGLVVMQERTKMLGGDLKICSSPGTGTKLDLKLPIKETVSVQS
jgi:PAS domain S-box-containing protein